MPRQEYLAFLLATVLSAMICSSASAFDPGALSHGMVAWGERLLVSWPDGTALAGWAARLAPILGIWLAATGTLFGTWIALTSPRAAQAVAASAAADPTARWQGLIRYAILAFVPALLAFLVIVLWMSAAKPPPDALRNLFFVAFPVLAGALSMALVHCAFTLLAAHGRRAERETTRRLPPQIGMIVGLLSLASLMRQLERGFDPVFSDAFALAAETIAALIAWRATGQQRLTLRQLLRGESKTPDADAATLPERFTAAIADRWHILSYLFISLSLMARYGAFGESLRFGMFTDLALSLTLVILAGVGIMLAERLHGHILRRMNITTEADLRDRLALRLGRVLRTGVQIAIAVWSGLMIVNLWHPGVGLDRDAGALRAASTTMLALYALWFIWTLVDAVLDWSSSRTIGRGTRMRTLLPFLRNFAFVVVVTLAAMSALSNLGVDVAPLLAGAGVVGIAIGIGAQKLVGDVITGIFIIFEDSIAVGETVEAADKTGVVEGLTIRTLKLRDGDGALHSIPFSSITTLKNCSRGYSAYTVSVTILHLEDTDRALAEVARIGKDISEDPAWAYAAIGPFSLWGVDQVSPNGVVIKGNIRAQPNAQWGLGREINRRLALRFAELGIAQIMPVTAWGGQDRAQTV